MHAAFLSTVMQGCDKVLSERQSDLDCVIVSNLQAVLEDLQTRFGALKTLRSRQG